MTGRIEIFRVELQDRSSGAAMTLAGGRQFDESFPFYIDLDGSPLRLWMEQAVHFARAISSMAARRRQAKSAGMAPRACVAWRQMVGDGVTNFKIEFGIDDGGCIYAEIGTVKISCDQAQDDALLAALERFSEDVRFVDAASPNAPSTGLRVAGYGQRPVNIVRSLCPDFTPDWAKD
jgi:hypothetical protein